MRASEPLGRRLFKLEPGESGKVTLFALLAGLIQAGVMVGLTAGDTLFLARVGFDKLPYVFMASPLVMVAYVPVFAFLISRFGTPRVLNATLAALVAGGVGLYFWIPSAAHWAGNPEGLGLIYYFTRLYADLWYIALYSLFWNFTDTFFDIQDAKRLFPLFSAGSAVGAMVGGGLVALVSPMAGLEALFLVWAAISLGTIPVVVAIRRRFDVLEEGEVEVEPALWAQLKETGGALAGSRFVLLLVTVLFAVVFLSSINEYEYLRILSGPLSEEELGALLGRLLVFVNIFNLFFSVFVFNRLVLFLGVGTVALIQPLMYLAVFYFLLFQGGTGAAILGFVAYHGILPSIELNNQNFLFNAVPHAVKQQVRTAVEGLAEPLATAVAGALLLGLIQFMPSVRVAALGFVFAAGYLAVAVLLRNAYLPSLVTNLKRGWLDLSRPAKEALAGLGEEEKARLREMVRGDEGEVAQCALRVLTINDEEQGFAATLEYLRKMPGDRISEARPFVEALLQRAGPDATREFLDWVGEGSRPRGARFLEEMGGHGLLMPSDVKGLALADEPAQVAAAVIVLWRSWDPGDRLMAAEGLVRLLGGSEEAVVAGLRAVGRIDDPSLARYAASHLTHSSPLVRSEAMAVLRSIVTTDSAALVPDILEALPGADERGKYDGLEALGKITDPTCVVRLLDLAVDFSPPIRRMVLRVLERMGLRSVPASVAVFVDPRHPYPARAIAARFLGTAALPQLEAVWPSVVENELDRAHQFRTFRQVLAGEAKPTSGIRVLRRFYRHTQDRIVDFILETLHIAGRLPAFELLSSSLRSELTKERANALETVEQGVPRALFRRLVPLLRDVGDSDGAEDAGFAGPMPSVQQVLEAALDSPFALEAAAAADALWVEENPEILARLRGRLADLRGSVYRDTVVKLAASGQEEATPVDLIDLMAGAPFFRSLRIQDLQEIARQATVRELRPDEVLYHRGQIADWCFVVAQGRGRRDGRAVGPGALLGDEALGTAATYSGDVVSEGMAVVCVPAGAVLELAEVSSALGVELIRHAAGAFGVRAL